MRLLKTLCTLLLSAITLSFHSLYGYEIGEHKSEQKLMGILDKVSSHQFMNALEKHYEKYERKSVSIEKIKFENKEERKRFLKEASEAGVSSIRFGKFSRKGRFRGFWTKVAGTLIGQSPEDFIHGKLTIDGHKIDLPKEGESLSAFTQRLDNFLKENVTKNNKGSYVQNIFSAFFSPAYAQGYNPERTEKYHDILKINAAGMVELDVGFFGDDEVSDLIDQIKKDLDGYWNECQTLKDNVGTKNSGVTTIYKQLNDKTKEYFFSSLGAREASAGNKVKWEISETKLLKELLKPYADEDEHGNDDPAKSCHEFFSGFLKSPLGHKYRMKVYEPGGDGHLCDKLNKVKQCMDNVITNHKAAINDARDENGYKLKMYNGERGDYEKSYGDNPFSSSKSQ